ncbi:hypothetical protein SJI19_19850 [Acerihabitans sp. TG2]|uniref:hypothetical protein n=1 Tax=Acerihabitans sp. TG2 TaxID=3096008 RepID=UPI002B223A6C|nr:hypothetical protein [Acerihabitans sp. TG2]MEA9392760.1 hypothetical protein [Acerihabitans sp. TG2]
MSLLIMRSYKYAAQPWNKNPPVIRRAGPTGKGSKNKNNNRMKRHAGEVWNGQPKIKYPR